MNYDQELNDAQVRVEQGWDRNTVVNMIRRTLNLLDKSTESLEDHLNHWQEKIEEDIQLQWTTISTTGQVLYEGCQELRKDMDYEKLKGHYMMARQLKESIDGMTRLIAGAPQEIIRLSKDLTTIVDKLMSMNDKVAEKFPESNSRESDEWASYLTKEQLITVLQWVEENKEAKAAV